MYIYICIVMEDPTVLDNTHSQFITVSYTDQSLDSHGEQISNECTNISKFYQFQ